MKDEDTIEHDFIEFKRMLEESKNEISSLEKEFSHRKKEMKINLANRIMELIKSHDLMVEEVVPLILTNKQWKVLCSEQRTYYVDPENPENTYTRGATPKWMKDKMIEKGLDPSSSKDRNMFKSTHLQLIGD